MKSKASFPSSSSEFNSKNWSSFREHFGNPCVNGLTSRPSNQPKRLSFPLALPGDAEPESFVFYTNIDEMISHETSKMSRQTRIPWIVSSPERFLFDAVRMHALFSGSFLSTYRTCRPLFEAFCRRIVIVVPSSSLSWNFDVEQSDQRGHLQKKEARQKVLPVVRLAESCTAGSLYYRSRRIVVHT